jgi:hypothetical protein
MQSIFALTSDTVVQWTILSSAVVVAIAIVGLTVVSSISFRQDNKVASEFLTRVFVGGAALRLLTVLAVILSATVLSLAGQLKEGTIALLSGIAGYVLGGISTQVQTRKKAAPNEEPSSGSVRET